MGKYAQLYETLKNKILDGTYKYKERLPSIREMENATGYSRTTIEAAYQQLLVEGYIVSKNKVGYFIDVDLKETAEMTSLRAFVHSPSKPHYRYDFSGGSVDPDSFNLEIWKKYLRMTLHNQKEFYEYGHQQGELSLRQALSRYSSMYRGVICEPDNMIIDSGFQALLSTLCSLLKNVKRVGMPQSGFVHAQMVFQDHNKETIMLEEDDEGILLEALKKANIQLLYLNTSSSGKKAKPLSISRRLQIIEYAKKNDVYIIEDDHNGELRYSAKPVPAMQSADLVHVIYIGSFSKLLMPSLRIAYMVLPVSLMERYVEKRRYYHQNVSKLEQLALAMYIEEGQLIRQLKKLRRLYAKKSTLILKLIKEYIDPKAQLLEETALRVRIELKNPIDMDSFYHQLHDSDLDLLILSNNSLLLSFSSISLSDIQEGIIRLSQLLVK